MSTWQRIINDAITVPATQARTTLPLLGNLLEWYDFAIYGYLAQALGDAFFPSESNSAALLSSFAVFAVGFLMRPIGSLVLGPLADLYGRRRMLLLSLTLMGGSSLLTGLLPTRLQWGETATVLLVLLRMVQGFSVGGEYTGSIAFTAELTSADRRGLMCSFTSSGAQIGIALASLVVAGCSALLGEQALMEWGWRLPFLMGSSLLVLPVWMQHRLPETLEIPARPETASQARHWLQALGTQLQTLIAHRRLLVQVMALVCTSNVVFYLLYVFLVTHSSQSPADGVAARTITSSVQLVGIGITTLAGWLVDRYGLIRINGMGTAAMVATSLPALAIGLQGSPVTLLIALSLATPALMVILGSQGLLGVTIAPLEQRCGVFSIAYSTSVALCGGTAPLIATWMVDQNVPYGTIALYPLPFAAATCWALWRARGRSSHDF